MSLRQSMYTGLAHPEVKVNGLSSEKSTAFTSSSILAVVSAMNAWSAECMGARILAVTIAAFAPFREAALAQTADPVDRRARRRDLRRPGAVLPLRGQGRQE